MNSQTRIDLIRLLLEKTQKGRLDWQITAGDDEFQVAFGDNTLAIRSLPGELPNSTDYLFRLFNAEGRIIESFLDTEVGSDIPDGEPRVSFYRSVSELHSLARRKALGVEAAISSVIQQLLKL